MKSAAGDQSAPDGAQPCASGALFDPNERFRLACAMLRKAGKLDHGKDADPLPGQRRGESAVDWLARLGLAPNKQTAAEMLILANGWQSVLDELTGSKFIWVE